MKTVQTNQVIRHGKDILAKDVRYAVPNRIADYFINRGWAALSDGEPQAVLPHLELSEPVVDEQGKEIVLPDSEPEPAL